MNVYDSRRMADVLIPLGYSYTDDPKKAEVVILNTCHIREKAAEKLYSELGRYEKIKEERKTKGRTTVIAVAGCVAQAEGEQVFRRAPYVDIVLGPQTYHRLPQMVTRALSKERGNSKSARILDVDFPVEPKFDYLPEVKTEEFSAFLTVQEGCDKFCTFCVVPYTRGAEYSRSVEDIVSEARQLISCGVKEITLLGQNVNAYNGRWHSGGSGAASLAQLLYELAKIEKLELLRYTTSHPADMTNELIHAHGELDKLAPFLHLPVQSGSNDVLARMNRRHSRDDYLRIIDFLKAENPILKLSSDFIVGFPGETDENFLATLSLVDEVDFVQAFSFKYSPRPGTPGASMENQIPEEVKSERLTQLQALLMSKQRKFNEACVGTVMPVLLDRPGRNFGQLAGRSPYMQAVHVTAPADYIGKRVNLKVEAAFTNSLGAVFADTPLSFWSERLERNDG